ncbi:11425_t:CDS:2, partial [Acaulospora colombiana]
IVRPQLPPFTGCTVITVAKLKLHMIFISSLVFETCVIILTLIKVYPIFRYAPGRLPLVTMLLNDAIVVGAIACNRLLIRIQELLLRREIVELETMVGTGITGRVAAGTLQHKTGDIALSPTAYGQRDRRIRRPISTQCFLTETICVGHLYPTGRQASEGRKPSLAGASGEVSSEPRCLAAESRAEE